MAKDDRIFFFFKINNLLLFLRESRWGLVVLKDLQFELFFSGYAHA
jgi:hypothetical protein